MWRQNIVRRRIIHNNQRVLRNVGKQLLTELSATAWKRTKTGKMKMVRFSGIKFAAGLAHETLNLLPSHEIRRTRIRRQIFSMDAKKKIVHFQIAGIDAVLGRR